MPSCMPPLDAFAHSLLHTLRRFAPHTSHISMLTPTYPLPLYLPHSPTYSTDGQAMIKMGGTDATVTVPVRMISFADGQRIRAAIGAKAQIISSKGGEGGALEALWKTGGLTGKNQITMVGDSGLDKNSCYFADGAVAMPFQKVREYIQSMRGDMLLHSRYSIFEYGCMLLATACLERVPYTKWY